MKVYYISYVDDSDEGQIEGFTSKLTAKRRLKELREELEDTRGQLPDDVESIIFPISASGIIRAFELGASFVTK